MTIETADAAHPNRSAKSSRLNFRVRHEQRALLEEAAAVSGRSLTEFVLSSAQAAAHDILADRTRFVLPAEEWDAFATALERPPRAMPKITALLTEPTSLDAE